MTGVLLIGAIAVFLAGLGIGILLANGMTCATKTGAPG